MLSYGVLFLVFRWPTWIVIGSVEGLWCGSVSTPIRAASSMACSGRPCFSGFFGHERNLSLATHSRRVEGVGGVANGCSLSISCLSSLYWRSFDFSALSTGAFCFFLFF